jgi:hypothetical protein
MAGYIPAPIAIDLNQFCITTYWDGANLLTQAAAPGAASLSVTNCRRNACIPTHAERAYNMFWSRNGGADRAMIATLAAVGRSRA